MDESDSYTYTDGVVDESDADGEPKEYVQPLVGGAVVAVPEDSFSGVNRKGWGTRHIHRDGKFTTVEVSSDDF